MFRNLKIMEFWRLDLVSIFR